MLRAPVFVPQRAEGGGQEMQVAVSPEETILPKLARSAYSRLGCLATAAVAGLGASR
jgi:hypothetical protein